MKTIDQIIYASSFIILIVTIIVTYMLHHVIKPPHPILSVMLGVFIFSGGIMLLSKAIELYNQTYR